MNVKKTVTHEVHKAAPVVETAPETVGTQWVVLVGSPLEGFSYHGPFNDAETAHKWAEHEKVPNWNVVSLNAPARLP